MIDLSNEENILTKTLVRIEHVAPYGDFTVILPSYDSNTKIAIPAFLIPDGLHRLVKDVGCLPIRVFALVNLGAVRSRSLVFHNWQYIKLDSGTLIV